MIFDHINSVTATWLARRVPALAEALAHVRSLPPDAPDGITQLRGDDMFVNVHGYDTLPAGECRWESHRHTVDVQCCLAGGEIIDWLPMGSLRPRDDYVATKDAEHWHPSDARTTQLVMAPGTFALFFAGELHRPKVHDGKNSAVRKLVVKIHAPLLDA